MAIITNIPQTWTAIGAPTAANEYWQCTDGTVEITAGATPATPDGIRLEAGLGVQVSAGKTISYRRVTDTAAVIRREAL